MSLRRKEQRIGLTASAASKPPVLQYHNGTWRIWTAYNPTLTFGTFIAMFADGNASQITYHPDGTETIQPL